MCVIGIKNDLYTSSSVWTLVDCGLLKNCAWTQHCIKCQLGSTNSFHYNVAVVIIHVLAVLGGYERGLNIFSLTWTSTRVLGHSTLCAVNYRSL